MQERLDKINSIPSQMERSVSLMQAAEKAMEFGKAIAPYVSKLDKYSLA